MTPLHYLMKGFYLVENNIHTKTWCSENINCNFERACINVLTSTHNLFMDRKTRGSLTCSFEILVVFDMKFGMIFVNYEDS